MAFVGELLVITGPPGAGKSTVAAAVVDRFEPSALVSGDSFFGLLRRGYIPPWLPESAEQNRTVTEVAARAAGSLCAAGYAVVYDGVVGPWMLPTFIAATEVSRVHYVVLLPTEDECVHRVEHRTGHGFVDIPATRHMHKQFADASIDERHVIHDSHDSDATARIIIDSMTRGLLAISNDTEGG